MCCAGVFLVGGWSCSEALTHRTVALQVVPATARHHLQVLNFSIAYGKTAHGLSKDWGVDIKEAEETVNRWYSDRWQVSPSTHMYGSGSPRKVMPPA